MLWSCPNALQNFQSSDIVPTQGSSPTWGLEVLHCIWTGQSVIHCKSSSPMLWFQNIVQLSVVWLGSNALQDFQFTNTLHDYQFSYLVPTHCKTLSCLTWFQCNARLSSPIHCKTISSLTWFQHIARLSVVFLGSNTLQDRNQHTGTGMINITEPSAVILPHHLHQHYSAVCSNITSQSAPTAFTLCTSRPVHCLVELLQSCSMQFPFNSNSARDSVKITVFGAARCWSRQQFKAHSSMLY